MFSSLRNYSKNINQCERFYYDNYDYYNIYENIEKDYKDDLSKFVYHCNRRNTPVIVAYGQRQRFKHSRLIKGHQASNMEDFVNQFISIYMENNYSLGSRMYQKEPCLDAFQFLQFGPLNDIKYDKFRPFKMFVLTKSELADCIRLIINSNEIKIRQLEHEYENEDQRTMKLSHAQFHFAIQQYSLRVLTGTYQIINEQQYSQSFNLLFEFIVEVQRLMWEIVNGRMRTILLMAQPKTNYLNLIVHPLVLPIMTFSKYNVELLATQMGSNAPSLYKLVSAASEEQKARIVFINLDGNQSPHNLRSISSLSQPLLYISLFNQPSWLQKAETDMQYLFTSDDQNFTPSYSKLWQIFSQSIVKQFCEIQKASATKFMLFPLNSSYVNKKFVQKIYENDPNINVSQWKHSKFPNIQTSKDIHSLFEQIIYEQIRMFKPTMIFISYNGQINILEDHFTDIVRNCSIIADHRVVLFPNFTHLFQDEPLNVSEQEDQAEKLMCVHQFYQKNNDYKLQNINQERLFANLSMFLKYGPGIYNMEDRAFGTQSSKYGIGKLYLYLEALAKLEEFKFIEKYNIKQWNSQELTTLYDQYRNWEIKENKKENKYYQKLLATVISQLLCRNIPESQLQKILGSKLFYRLKFIVEQLKKQQQQAKIAIAQFNGHEIGQEFAITEKQGITKLLETHLEAEKQRLLSENLQNYKIKKHFYLAENQKSFGQVSCFKFSFDTSTDDKQEIYLQKYSQIIINEENQDIFIINYKSVDNRHMILHGSIKNSQIQKEVTVNEVPTNDDEGFSDINDYLEHHHLSEEGQTHQKQDIVYVQYNYCLHDRSMYLFWPIRWNLKEEARCKMLGIQYKPKRIFKMLKVHQHLNEQTFRYQQIRYQPSKQQIQVLPRWGCSCQSINENYFKIFGGIYDNQNDFKMIGRGMAVVEINNNGKYKTFSIHAQPKSKDNLVYSCLKPKINYDLKCGEVMSEQNAFKIYGGYGRDNTSFFNIFSYQEYDLDSNTILHRANQGKFTRRVVRTQKPLQSQKIGKFNVIINNYNISQIEQKFSDTPKDKFFFEKRNEGTGKSNELQILVFIDEAYRVNEFKTDRKKLFLFGFDRTVRQKIFLKCWSPQLYIADGMKAEIVNLSLKTQKTSSYIITNYLMPRQEDIVSLCLQQDRLYLLSNSPIIHSIDRAGLKFVLYEGSLTNINQVIRKREVQMITKYSFEQKHERFLNQKTIFALEEKIYLVGGLGAQNDMANNKYQREDYILETNRNKFRIKTRKIQSNSINLDMPNSVVIKQHEYFLLYSIVLQDIPMTIDQRQGVEWKIKLEKHMFENSQANETKIGQFKTYAHNNQNEGKVQRYSHSSIDEPKFVRILPYSRFDKSELREVLSKIMWRVDKNQLMQKKLADLQTLKKFHRQSNDKQLQIMLQNEWKIFEELINFIKKKSEVGTEVNYEQQQLLKDLKQAYYLVSKMIFEKILCLGAPQQNEHLFIAEDKSSKKVKYIAIGPLNTTKLNFFRIRFKNQLLTSLNQQRDDGIFYHPTQVGYYKFEYENLKPGISQQYSGQQITKPIFISMKQ